MTHRTASSASSARQWLSVAAALLLLCASGVGLFLWRSRSVQLLSVQSGSMAPNITVGDAVLVRPVAEDELQVGDVVSFYAADLAGALVTHRVVSVSESGQVTTKGDNNAQEDAVLDPNLLVGRVGYQFANLGYAIDFVRSRLGLALLVYLPAVLIVAGEARKLVGYFRPVYRHPMLIGRSSR